MLVGFAQNKDGTYGKVALSGPKAEKDEDKYETGREAHATIGVHLIIQRLLTRGALIRCLKMDLAKK